MVEVYVSFICVRRVLSRGFVGEGTEQSRCLKGIPHFLPLPKHCLTFCYTSLAWYSRRCVSCCENTPPAGLNARAVAHSALLILACIIDSAVMLCQTPINLKGSSSLDLLSNKFDTRTFLCSGEPHCPNSSPAMSDHHHQNLCRSFG